VRDLLAAGHVCTIMGYWGYEPRAARLRVPIVVTGFEPLDLFEGVYRCTRMLEECRSGVENQYARAVTREGIPMPSCLARRSSRSPRGNGAASVRSLRVATASALVEVSGQMPDLPDFNEHPGIVTLNSSAANGWSTCWPANSGR
jgi:hydrogenase expression/formation protein HypD